MPTDSPPAPPLQRLRVHYAKRGRLRFTSHRDVQRAFERALRRAAVPTAFSAGFSPHPKISYAGASPTGVASEAEYLEVAVSERLDPTWAREVLDAALPAGIDVLEVVEARVGSLTDRLEASWWEARLEGVDPVAAERAVAAFMTAGRVDVERLTKKGRRRLDARAPVESFTVARCGVEEDTPPYAILRLVVRHVTPAVRPDDVLTGLRRVADLAPPYPAIVVRLAQGPLDAAGGLADPLAPDRATSTADEAPSAGREEDGAHVVGVEPPA